MSFYSSETGSNDRIGRRLIHRVMGLIMTVVLISAFGFSQADDVHAESDEDETAGVIVMFSDDSDLTGQAAKKMLRSGANAVKDIEIEKLWTFDKPGKDTSVALVTSGIDDDKLVETLRKRPDVKYAEKDSKVHMLSVSDDEYSDLQWSMQTGDNTPNLPYEWDRMSGSDKVVAVVDTGVNYRHPDLTANMWVNTSANRSKGLKGKYGYDFIDGDEDPMDENGHGSHCAGIIGAVGDNGTGISGVNKKVRIMALRTLDKDGSASLSHEIAAYHYINRALDLGVPVTAINNSWGGGDESEIFKELIDIVGAKGAVTVAAAGNEGVDIDKYSSYPADVDSPYIISVAATKENGELVSFSNYGKSVDVAAPGTDILSTVSYDCYNPGIYGEKQYSVSSLYNDFESGSTDLKPEKFFVNGKEMDRRSEAGTDIYEDGEGRRVEVSIVENGLNGRGLRIRYQGLKEDDMVCAPMPYSLSGNYKSGDLTPQLSAMVRTSGADFSDYLGAPSFTIIEASADTGLTLDELEDYEPSGMYISGEEDYWSHLVKKSYEEEDKGGPSAGDSRQFIYALYSYLDGDYDVYLDDIGMMRDDLTDSSVLGQYDYMSGTSMATPFVSGAVALVRADMEAEYGTVNVEDLINTVCSMTKDSPELNTGGRGSLDFSCKKAVLPPRISKATVKNGRISIFGSGLDAAADDFSVRITKDGETSEVRNAEGATGKITFNNNGWINNIVDVEVTANGRSSICRNIYMVDGKKSYGAGDLDLALSDQTTTDGRNIYMISQEYGDLIQITKYDTSSKETSYIEPDNTLADVIKKKYKIKTDGRKTYAAIARSAVYMNGYLYMIADYGAVDTTEEYGRCMYDGSAYLVCTSVSKPDYKVLGKLSDIFGDDREGYTMAAYNGRLYLIGGYTVNDEPGVDDKIALSSVKVYDPAAKAGKRWSNGKSLPEGRYGGSAHQVGDKLVYTLGHTTDEKKYAPNMILSGSKWTVSRAEFPEPLNYDCKANTGMVSGGIVYVGMPVRDHGDSFIYDVAKDKYVDTGFNLIRKYSEFNELPEKKSAESVIIIIFGGVEESSKTIKAAVAGNTVYAVKPDLNEEDDEESNVVYTMPVRSGLVSVKKVISGKGKGSVSGCTVLMPGNDTRFTIKAKKGSYIKSVKVNGKKIKVKKNATKMTYTFKKLTKNAKISVKFAKKAKKTKKTKKAKK